MRNQLMRVAIAAAWTVAATGARAAEPPAAFGKPPPFEEALAAARKSGKPLVIDFGAEWCEPCKMLEADLLKPPGQAALQLVHFVRYDVDQPPGTAVREKFKVTSFPTLMAIDAAGKEADRQVGYGDFDVIRSWLARVPDLTVSLKESLARADAGKGDAGLQLLAGKRLVAAQRPADARRYLTRAAAAGDAKVAATASWALADAEVAAQTMPIRRRHAERLAARYPTSPEGLRAFRFLATLPDPPRPLLAKVIERRLEGDSEQPEWLDELVLYGLRAGAVDAAEKAARRLEPLAGKDPHRLLVVAEVCNARGETERAVALGERALAAATGPGRGAVEKDLARFRKGDRSPGPALAALTPDGDEGRRPELNRGPPPWLAVAGNLTRKIAEDCAPADEPLGEIQVHVFSGSKPGELELVPDHALPAATALCMKRAARAVQIPPQQTFRLSVMLDPPWFAQGLALARKTAGDCVPPVPPGERFEPLRVVLTAAGERPAIVIAPGQPALARCLERAFWFVRPPAGFVRAFTIAPSRPKPAESKPLTAENQGGDR